MACCRQGKGTGQRRGRVCGDKFLSRQKFAGYDDKNLARVNYKERFSLPSVEKGDILAVVYPPVPGKPGMLVTGML